MIGQDRVIPGQEFGIFIIPKCCFKLKRPTSPITICLSACQQHTVSPKESYKILSTVSHVLLELGLSHFHGLIPWPGSSPFKISCTQGLVMFCSCSKTRLFFCLLKYTAHLCRQKPARHSQPSWCQCSRPIAANSRSGHRHRPSWICKFWSTNQIMGYDLSTAIKYSPGIRMQVVEVHVDACIQAHAHTCKSLWRQTVGAGGVGTGIPLDSLEVDPGEISQRV